MPEENLSVANKGRFGEGLSKRVSEHISRGAIEKANVARGNVKLDIVNANIHVTHSSAVSCGLTVSERLQQPLLSSKIGMG